MTLVDTHDLERRTCRHCGAVMGDMLAHYRWHEAQDGALDAIAATLAPLCRDLERRAAEADR